jgi:hypothetical protein
MTLHPTLRAALLSACALLALPLSAHATVIKVVELETLARSADVIVRGTTGASVSAFTEDGKQIHTVTKVRVATTIKGVADSEIEVRTRGGTVGELTQMISGAPPLGEGREVILFLHRVSPRRFVIEGFVQGRFDVVKGPGGVAHVTQDLSAVGVLGADGAVRPGATLGPIPEADFVARIRKALEGKAP